MIYEQLSNIAEETGFSAWAPLDINTIELKPEVRDMCAVNSCGQYGKRWSCPPGCGTLEECGERIKSCTHGILVQTYGDIEDGFDFEAMMEIEADHKEHFTEMYEALREAEETVLAIGAGCCTACASVPTRMRPAGSRKSKFLPWKPTVCWCWKSAKPTACSTTTVLTKWLIPVVFSSDNKLVISKI